MVVWSCMKSNVLRSVSKAFKKDVNVFQKRYSGDHHRSMEIVPSRWQWHKFKDLLHFYTIVGLIPVGAIIFYANVFIGPATLEEIPEGYTPKQWEYYRSPITRFLVKHAFTTPQQDYEKFMHQLYEEDEKMKIRKLEKQIQLKMQERQDYQAYYYRPISGKYVRLAKKDADMVGEITGIKP